MLTCKLCIDLKGNSIQTLSTISNTHFPMK